jgi:putative photosynthetic complex assembly protein 2
VTGQAMLATLCALAMLEHWLMVLPLPSDALWRWSLEGREAHSGRMPR